MEEVTVSATSNPMPVFDYPGQVSVRGREEIDLFLPSNVSDLLRDVPGLEFSGGPRRTGETPSIRGRGGENVLILIDGARQSFISAHDGRFFLEPELIGRAEVLRGPASALYGSGAVGGVMAFDTVDAADLLDTDEGGGIRLRGGYQDVNEETFATATGYYLEDGLDLIGSINLRDSDDIKLGSGDTLPSDDDLLSGLLKAEYQLTETIKLEGSWLHFENDVKEPNNGQGVGADDPTLNALVNKDVETDTYRLGLSFNPSDNPWVNASLTAYNTETEVKESELASSRQTIRNIDTNGVTLRNVSSFSLGESTHRFTVGGDWYEDKQKGRDSNNEDGLRNGVPDGEANFFGAFAQLESTFEQPLGLPGDVLLVPGVRYDDFESKSDSVSAQDNQNDETSLRFGVSYGPVQWLRVFANYAEGFRAPSINELYLDGTHFQVPHPILSGAGVFVPNEFVPNPNLVPEESETIEAGLGFDFADVFTGGDRIALKGSYWESDVKNLIDIGVDFAFDVTCFPPTLFPCSAGTSFSENVADADLDGVEVEGTYNSYYFYSRVTYSTVNGENKVDGSDLGTLTPDRLDLDLRFKLPEYGTAIGTRIQLADSYERNEFNDDTGNIELIEERDDYAVFDIYASWQPAFLASIILEASVENIGDKD
ncbi:MAG: TonB-dependent receptor, partial [Pseudomonadota bacterium]